MICKAREAGLRAQREWELWIESELAGTSRFDNAMKRARANRSALLSDDCVPREVAEDLAEEVRNLVNQFLSDARVGWPKRMKDSAERALAKWDKWRAK